MLGLSRVTRFTAVAMLLTLLGAPDPCGAQAGPTPAGGGIRGIVYDSIRNRPVSGAIVRVEPLERVGIADAAGSFRIDSLAPGEYTLTGEDASLDELGIVISRRVVVEPAAGDTFVQLATPGLADFVARLCGPTASLDSTQGVLFGIVRGAESGSLLAGAEVEISWLVEAPARNALPATAVVRPRTDDHGRFAACGVPREQSLQVGARAAGEGELAPVAVSLSGESVSRLDLAVAPVGARRVGAVRGVVLDTAGHPLRNVSIVVEGDRSSARSDSLGRFALRGLRLGTGTLVARRPGFAPAILAVTIAAADTTDVTVRMHPAVLLSSVEVRAARLSRVMEQVERRQLTGFGYAFTGESLKQFPNHAALFRMVPSVRVVQGRMPSMYRLLAPNDRSITGEPCHIDIIIDGLLSDTEQLAAYPMEDVVAIEVYPRGAQVPPAYRLSPTGCGVVLVWTTFAR